MPEIRDYQVVQTRKVNVTANSAADAVRIAKEAFDGKDDGRANIQLEEVWGSTSNRVTTTSISATEIGK